MLSFQRVGHIDATNILHCLVALGPSALDLIRSRHRCKNKIAILSFDRRRFHVKMKGHFGAFALLSSIVSGAAAVDARDVQYADQDPATWCVTYLSTYLAPVSIATDLPRPAENTTDVGLISTSTAQDPDLASSAAS